MYKLKGDLLPLYDLLAWNKYAAAVNFARQSFLEPISHYPNWTINIRANMAPAAAAAGGGGRAGFTSKEGGKEGTKEEREGKRDE